MRKSDRKSDKVSAKSPLSLPPVDMRVIKGVVDEDMAAASRYAEVFRDDPDLALHIRQRAQAIGAGDLDLTEEVSRLALEVVATLKRQVVIEGLNELYGVDSGLPPA